MVNSLVGNDIGNSDSKLNITATGTTSRFSKSGKGTDLNYFTQFSYAFTSNNTIEVGSFEVQTGKIQASARAWDPALFLLLNKAVSSIISEGVAVGSRRAYQSSSIESLQTSQKVYNGTTLYRLGTSGVSKTGAEAQYCSLENLLAMGVEEYAKKYGINIKNVQNANFVETATLKPGARYITCEAPTMQGAPLGSGGGIEAVVEQGGTTANRIIPIKR